MAIDDCACPRRSLERLRAVVEALDAGVKRTPDAIAFSTLIPGL